ncbi:MAG TPA: SGNH/GDSL hydrolase family protein, partial [Allocoleopsis sp.]
GDRVGFNLAAIEQIQTIASQSQAKFLLVMTPLLRELGEPGSRDYEQKARQRLNELTQQKQIELIDFLPIFNAAPQPQSLYRDHIHLSPAGNQLVTHHIIQALNNL